MINFSIIVCSYNNFNVLKRVIAGILGEIEGNETVELIVVDSSDDGSTEKLKQMFPNVHITHPDQRLLPGPARNLGASKSTGQNLIFLDGDCLPDKEWMKGFESAIEHLYNRIVCGAVDLDEPNDLSQFMEYIIYKLPENSSIPRGDYHFTITENMMISRDNFLEVGGFGNSDSANDVQMDVARRTANIGLFFEPTARVFHIHPKGWKFHFAKLNRIGKEQFELLTLKNYQVGRWIKLLFPIVFLARWGRITWRILRYRPNWIGRYILVQPMLWIGLVLYQIGLWQEFIGRMLRK